MRFDLARVEDDLKTFAFPREAGSEGERRAADLAAERLGAAGLLCERLQARGSIRLRVLRSTLPWVFLAAGLAAASLYGWWAPSPQRRGVVVSVVFAAFWLLAVVRLNARWAWLDDTTVPVVAGTRWRDRPAPTRVVFQTNLDACQRGPLLRWPALSLVGLVTLHALTTPPGYSTALLLVVLWMLLLCYERSSISPAFQLDPEWNRGGLPLLLELARVWPPSSSSRVEAWFLATGGGSLDQAGVRAFLESRPLDFLKVPTLFVGLRAPASGSYWTLLTSRAALAARVASDLWIPHQVISARRFRRMGWPIEPIAPEFVLLVGSREDPGVAPKGPDTERLKHAGQLAAEIALRWSVQARGESAARSAQNPG